MTSEPRAFITQDAGAATTAAALVGRVGGRWRLIGSLALPAGADPAAMAALLVHRASAADPVLTSALRLDRVPADELPRVEVASHPARRLAVVAGSERALAPLVAAAMRSGWRTSSASAETADPLAMSTLLLDPGVGGILAGAGDPPAADERRALGELGALVAAAANRRPDVPVVLAGGMGGELHAFGDVADRPGRVLVRVGRPCRAGRRGAARAIDRRRPAPRRLAARPRRCRHGTRGDPRPADRRGGDRLRWRHPGRRLAGCLVGGSGPGSCDRAVCRAGAGHPDDQVVDRVSGWSTSTTDRHRLRDRMRELRIAPWADASGDGVALRLAAARAALSQLARWTPDWAERPAADLVAATGGAWAVASAPSVALALVDVLRRAGATQFALDHARLLAPLGAIPDAGERRAMLGDLADDLLAPLGTVVTPAGLRHGRSAGALQLHGVNGPRDRDLRPGDLERMELPPGATAVAEFRFHDTVRLGGRGRHFAIDVTGGLGGLVVDLRDVPLRLPDRADLRAELLETWQAAVGTGRGA